MTSRTYTSRLNYGTEEQSEAATLPIYDGSGERIASVSGVAAPHNQLLLQVLEMENKIFEGAGAVRGLAAGHAFTLSQHERYNGDNALFKVLVARHEARNSYQSQIKGARHDNVKAGTYRNEFGCVCKTVAIVQNMRG